MKRVPQIFLLMAALLVAGGQATNAQELTKKFLDGTVWDGQFNIEARQSYTAPTTLTFKLSPLGDLVGVVKSKFFRTIRKLPAKGSITKGGILVVDFSTASAQRMLWLKLDNGRLGGDAGTMVRGFPGRGQAFFEKR